MRNLNIDPIINLSASWHGAKWTRAQAWELLSKSAKEAYRTSFLKCGEAEIERRIEESIQQIKLCETHNIELIPFFSPLYPVELKQMEYPPPLISVIGSIQCLSLRPSLTVVGSRNAGLSTLQWLDQELGDFLDKYDCNILSGGARGVDQKSHAVSLRKNKPTVCFVPSGLLQLYPQDLVTYKDWIVQQGGALVSIYAPLEKMRKHYFHERNALMALIGQYTLVLQARRRSGTLVTARSALDWGRSVGVVPDFPCESTLGGLDLLHSGADLIRDSDDLYYAMNTNLSRLVQGTPAFESEEQKDDIRKPSAHQDGQMPLFR